MAKAKAKESKPQSGESKSKSSATAKPVTLKTSSGKKSASKSNGGKATEMSHATIGHAAGDVWGLLSDQGPKSIAELKKAVNASPDVVVAAVGWLAREDKLEYISNGKSVKIGLR